MMLGAYDRIMLVLHAISVAATIGTIAQLVAAILTRRINWPLFIATLVVDSAATLAWSWFAWNRR